MSKDLRFDDLFKYVGGFGYFQIFQFVILNMVGMFGPEPVYVNFIAAELPHWCKVEGLAGRIPFEDQKKVGIPYNGDEDDEEDGYSNCQYCLMNYSLYSPEQLINWNRNDTNCSEPIDCTDGWVYDRYQFRHTVVSEFNLVCGDEWLIPLISTLYIAGMSMGAPSAGFMSDKIGRKKALLLYATIKVIGGFGSAFAPNYIFFVVSRLVMGFGATSCYLCAFVILVENSGMEYRSWFGVGLSIGYAVGYMIVPGYAYAIRDYEKLLVVPCSASALLVVLCFLFVDESPRWLLLKGKYMEARKVLKFMAKVNGNSLPDDLDLSRVKMDSQKSEKSEASLFDLVKSPILRPRTCIIYSYWFTTSLVYYSLTLNSATLAGDLFLNTFLLGAVEIPANFLCIIMMERKWFGRRITASFSLLLIGVASLANIAIILDGGQDTLSTVMFLIGKAGGSMGFSVIYVYSGELYPTELRTVGMGSSSMFARFSGMAAPYIGGPLTDIWEPMPSLIYGVLGTVVGTLVLFLPETLGQKLPTTVRDAEELGRRKKKKKSKPTSDIYESKVVTNEKDNPAFENISTENTKF